MQHGGESICLIPKILELAPRQGEGDSKDFRPISLELKLEREICNLDLLNLDKLSWRVKIIFRHSCEPTSTCRNNRGPF